jgi:hypothetical protein
VPAPPAGRVFISYRRQETSHLAGRLYDRFASRFGEDQVFMDVDTIELGDDFAHAITQAVSTCEILLAVIGPQWLSVADKAGGRRLDVPGDIVRLEIQVALDRDVRVIPILVEDAAMPRPQELPDSLVRLARRNALTIRHDSFGYDVQRLVAALERMFAANAPTAGSGSFTAQAPTAERTSGIVRAPEPLQVLSYPKLVNAVAFSPDGRLLATGGADDTARVWEVASGKEHARLTHDASVWGVVFSRTGTCWPPSPPAPARRRTSGRWPPGRNACGSLSAPRRRVSPSARTAACLPPAVGMVRRAFGSCPQAGNLPGLPTAVGWRVSPSARMVACWPLVAPTRRRRCGCCGTDHSPR